MYLEKSVGKNQKLESWLVWKAFQGKGYWYRKANIKVGNINCSWKGTIQIYHFSIGIFSNSSWCLQTQTETCKLRNFQLETFQFHDFRTSFPTMCKSSLPLNFQSSKNSLSKILLFRISEEWVNFGLFLEYKDVSIWSGFKVDPSWDVSSK